MENADETEAKSLLGFESSLSFSACIAHNMPGTGTGAGLHPGDSTEQDAVLDDFLSFACCVFSPFFLSFFQLSLLILTVRYSVIPFACIMLRQNQEGSSSPEPETRAQSPASSVAGQQNSYVLSAAVGLGTCELSQSCGYVTHTSPTASSSSPLST